MTEEDVSAPERVWVLGKLGSCEDVESYTHDLNRNQDCIHNDHSGANLPIAVLALDGKSVVGVSCGLFHAAAVTRQGDCYTWGGDQCGQLGQGSGLVEPRNNSARISRSSDACLSEPGDNFPVNVVSAMLLLRAYGGPGLGSISCGGAHTVCVCQDGKTYSFGSNAFGQLGLGGSGGQSPAGDNVQPTKGDKGWWTYGKGLAWSASDKRNRRDRAENLSVPCEMRVSTTVCQAACGGRHTLLLTHDGAVFSFGDGSNGRLGHGSLHSRRSPKRVDALAQVRVACICAGWAHGMAADEEGRVYTWGCGGNGRLGHGNIRDCWQPRLVCSIRGVVHASCGYEHSAVCDQHGHVWCWGLGERGQLGSGSVESSLVPAQVRSLVAAGKHVTLVACGGGHTAAVTREGQLLTWGRGDVGQLGHGDDADRLHCKVVRALADLKTVAVCCGWAVTLAVTSGPAQVQHDATAVERESTAVGVQRESTAVGVQRESTAVEGLDVQEDSEISVSMQGLGGVCAQSSGFGGDFRIMMQGYRRIPLPATPNAACPECSVRATLDVSVVHRGVRYYSLTVLCGQRTWRTLRRFTQFRSLMSQLHKKGIAKDVHLPPKRLTDRLLMGEEDEERFQALQVCLDAALRAPEAIEDACVLAFLDMHGTDPPTNRHAGSSEGDGSSHGTSEHKDGKYSSTSSASPKQYEGTSSIKQLADKTWQMISSGNGETENMAKGHKEGARDVCHARDTRECLDTLATQMRTQDRGQERDSKGHTMGEDAREHEAAVCLDASTSAAPEARVSDGGLHAVESLEKEVWLPGYIDTYLTQPSARSEYPKFDTFKSRQDSNTATEWQDRVFSLPPSPPKSLASTASEGSIAHRKASNDVWCSLSFWLDKGLPAWTKQTKGMRVREARRNGGFCALVRARAWELALGIESLQTQSAAFAAARKTAQNARLSDDAVLRRKLIMIDVDILRTLAHLHLFQQGHPCFDKLRVVLECIAFHQEGFGYVQGMSYLAAVLVLHTTSEVEAFAYLTRLLERPFFRCFYRDDAEALRQRMQVLELTLSSNLPTLHAHLSVEGVLCGMFVPAWFVSLFSKQLPLTLCVRIWDYYLLEGEAYLYRAAVGVLRSVSTRLREMDAEGCLRSLSSLSIVGEELGGDHEKLLESIDAIVMPSAAEQILWNLAKAER